MTDQKPFIPRSKSEGRPYYAQALGVGNFAAKSSKVEIVDLRRNKPLTDESAKDTNDAQRKE